MADETETQPLTKEDKVFMALLFTPFAALLGGILKQSLKPRYSAYRQQHPDKTTVRRWLMDSATDAARKAWNWDPDV